MQLTGQVLVEKINTVRNNLLYINNTRNMNIDRLKRHWGCCNCCRGYGVRDVGLEVGVRGGLGDWGGRVRGGGGRGG